VHDQQRGDEQERDDPEEFAFVQLVAQDSST
jgi:hypothetical protein